MRSGADVTARRVFRGQKQGPIGWGGDRYGSRHAGRARAGLVCRVGRYPVGGAFHLEALAASCASTARQGYRTVLGTSSWKGARNTLRARAEGWDGWGQVPKAYVEAGKVKRRKMMSGG